jgi:hypothetical protein
MPVIELEEVQMVETSDEVLEPAVAVVGGGIYSLVGLLGE